MNTLLDQQDIRWTLTRRTGEPLATLQSLHVRPQERPVSRSGEEERLAVRCLFLEPERGWRSGYLFAWTSALSFGSGLCALAVAPAFDVTVPRWFILVYGVACALLALLAPLRTSGNTGDSSIVESELPDTIDASPLFSHGRRGRQPAMTTRRWLREPIRS